MSRSEVLMVNIGSLSTGGRVSAVKADLAKIALTQPVCTEVGEKIALSRRVEKHWRCVVYICACVCTFVYACVRARVCVCVCVCTCVYTKYVLYMCSMRACAMCTVHMVYVLCVLC